MEHPLISFCITTFKRHDYLKKTLESIRLQTYSNLEVIVCDNDVEQSGRPVVEGLNDARFKYSPNEQNLGMKKSFNRSLQQSSGTYIVMIADDDPVYPDMLQTLLDLSKQYPAYGMFLGGCNLFCTNPRLGNLYSLKVGMNSCLANKNINDVSVYTPDKFLTNFFNFNILPYYLWSTCMVKREILIEKGGVPDYDTAFLGDYAYMSVMASHSGCVVINYPLGHQTIHEQNFGRAQNEQIGKAATNFISYVSEKIRHVPNWPVIEERMNHFIALWVISHLAFLKRYYSIFKTEEPVDLKPFEKEIFAMPLMKNYRMKYYLKTNMPLLHDFIAKQKKRMTATA